MLTLWSSSMTTRSPFGPVLVANRLCSVQYPRLRVVVKEILSRSHLPRMLVDAQRLKVRSAQQKSLEGHLRLLSAMRHLSTNALLVLALIKMLCCELPGASQHLRIDVSAVGGDARFHRRTRRWRRRRSRDCVWPVYLRSASIRCK